MNRKQKGFTLIELLIVVAIIGILAAIAIPNLLTAMQRSKQKRTMADMRSVGTAWEARATDVNQYTAAGFTLPTTDMPIATLSGILSPTYIKAMPQKDGWDTEFDAVADANSYALASYGRNKSQDQAFSTINAAAGTSNFDCDIVFSNGSFVLYPEGMQQ